MEFSFIQLLIDFGLVVLIWLVQLCIYPAFTYFEKTNLIRWHEAYTPKITLVVFPLMLGQLMIATFLLYMDFKTQHLINAALVCITWASTFLIYVPLHQKIALKKNPIKNSYKLVRLNWIRVFIWSLIFIHNILFLIFS